MINNMAIGGSITKMRQLTIEANQGVWSYNEQNCWDEDGNQDKLRLKVKTI